MLTTAASGWGSLKAYLTSQSWGSVRGPPSVPLENNSQSQSWTSTPPHTHITHKDTPHHTYTNTHHTLTHTPHTHKHTQTHIQTHTYTHHTLTYKHTTTYTHTLAQVHISAKCRARLWLRDAKQLHNTCLCLPVGLPNLRQRDKDLSVPDNMNSDTPHSIYLHTLLFQYIYFIVFPWAYFCLV